MNCQKAKLKQKNPNLIDQLLMIKAAISSETKNTKQLTLHQYTPNMKSSYVGAEK